MLEITETAFGNALKETLELGAEQERERIVHAITNDAVIQTNVNVQWLEYLIGIIENV